MVKYMPLTLPIYWILRLFKLLFIKSRQTLNKIKTLKNKALIAENKEMFHKIDL